ncbi:hypothetical protein [Gordonibacter sp.]|uniref:hypothetical protein n=2 Tax=Gordonibacter sp. TaxID=1968902 RepID=UPI002FC9D28D
MGKTHSGFDIDCYDQVQRVRLLEEACLSGSSEAVDALYDSFGSFEYVSVAFAIACVTGNEGIARSLYEKGATLVDSGSKSVVKPGPEEKMPTELSYESRKFLYMHNCLAPSSYRRVDDVMGGRISPVACKQQVRMEYYADACSLPNEIVLNRTTCLENLLRMYAAGCISARDIYKVMGCLRYPRIIDKSWTTKKTIKYLDSILNSKKVSSSQRKAFEQYLVTEYLNASSHKALVQYVCSSLPDAANRGWRDKGVRASLLSTKKPSQALKIMVHSIDPGEISDKEKEAIIALFEKGNCLEELKLVGSFRDRHKVFQL